MVSFYFWFMMAKSSWVPSHTQGLFPTCYRRYYISWVLQELLLSYHGWGIGPWARLYYVVLPMLLLLDSITNWHVFEQVCVMLVLKLYCFRYCSWTWCCNIYIWTPLYDELFCEPYVTCDVYVESCMILVVCWRLFGILCDTRQTTGFIWVQVW